MEWTRERRIAPWYRGARIGLFVHWGMLTGDHEKDPFGPEAVYPYTTAEAFERAAAEAGWSADKWVRTAKRLRAKYMTVAAFHSQLGYLRLWPSRVPGSAATKRDYVQELLDAAGAAGIKLIVYINRDPSHARDGGVEWLDKEAYRAYKGDASVDMTTREGFLAYSLDVIDELIARYPSVAGLWFDGYHDKEEAQAVFAHIHARAPQWLTINNDFGAAPVDDEDAMSLEDFGKRCSPDYDYASGTWVGPGDKEFAFKTKWDWFYVGEGRREWKGYELNYANVPDNATVVKRILSIVGSSWNAHLGYGPRIGGEFPALLNDFTAHFERYMAWAEESIYGTVGGGYHEGGFPPGHWNDGAYGVTTLQPGGRTHYLHVLTAPQSPRLVVADTGYEVREAKLLKTGQALKFRQEGGWLTIEVPSWAGAAEDGAVVVKLTTAAAPSLVPRERMTATASGERADEPAANVLTPRYEERYRAGGDAVWPATVTLQLGGACEIAGLCVLQPESGAVVGGGWGAPDSERIRAYAVHVSRDGAEWGEPVAADELRNQRGLQAIVFPRATAAYVRFTAYGNYAGTDVCRLIRLDVVLARP